MKQELSQLAEAMGQLAMKMTHIAAKLPEGEAAEDMVNAVARLEFDKHVKELKDSVEEIDDKVDKIDERMDDLEEKCSAVEDIDTTTLEKLSGIDVGDLEEVLNYSGEIQDFPWDDAKKSVETVGELRNDVDDHEQRLAKVEALVDKIKAAFMPPALKAVV